MINVHYFTFSPLQENTYVLSNEKGQALIIDAGCYFTNEEETLKNYITSSNIKPFKLINTHCHLDHVFGNKWAAKTFKLQLHLNPLEEQMLQWAPASGAMYGLTFQNYTGPLNFLQPGEQLQLGSDVLQILFTPGHSPGSSSISSEAQKFIVSGDALDRESFGRTDLPGGNHNQLLQSIRTQLFTLPDDTVVYSGHGQPTTIGYEKKHNPFLNA